MASEENVSRRTMQIILNEDPGFCPYCKRKVEGLTKSQRIKRLQRCKKLIRRHGKKSTDRIIFCGEKLFYTEQYNLSIPKMMSYIPQLSRTYLKLKTFEKSNAFKRKVLL